MTPDYLVIGHLTRDVADDGSFRAGGTVIYAAMTAARLGMRAAIVTAFGPDLDPKALLPEIDIAVNVKPSPETTTFRNIYRGEEREQFILGRALPLSLHDVPTSWRNAAIVHLGPVAQELPPALAEAFPDSFLGVTPQGWLRHWGNSGRVIYTPWPQAAKVLSRVNAAVLSRDDVDGNERVLAEYEAAASVMATTVGSEGCWVHWMDRRRHFPAFKVELADATGAGDVFATAFFIALARGENPWEAARFANAAASFAVAADGWSGLATAEQVRQRMQQDQ